MAAISYIQVHKIFCYPGPPELDGGPPELEPDGAPDPDGAPLLLPPPLPEYKEYIIFSHIS